ncbi:hypothetical protein VP01_4435g2, partial [Puccinia sorghi]
TKPQLEKVSVFGSSEFVLVAPDKRQKLDARSIEGAIDTELDNLRQKQFWTVRRLPKQWPALGAQWVFAHKENSDGSICYKACYVAKGFNQKKGPDYAHIFAATATLTMLTGESSSRDK